MLFRARVEDGRHARGPYVLLDSAVFGLSGVSLLHNLILYFFLKVLSRVLSSPRTDSELV